MDEQTAGFIRAFDYAVEQLTSARQERDEWRTWLWVNSALDWLYRADQNEKGEKKSPREIAYFGDRNVSKPARTLAGLIWVRGLAVHHAAEVRAMIQIPTEIMKRVDGEWVASSLTDAEGNELQFSRVEVGWPTRSDLPEGIHNWGREKMYDECVSERRLLDPLAEARAYVVDDDRPYHQVPKESSP